MEWFNPTAIAAFITAIGAVVVSVWVALRKQSVEEAKVNQQLKTEDDTTAIDEWRTYAKQLNSANEKAIRSLEQRHSLDIGALRDENREQAKQIEALQQSERKCQVDYAVAMTRIQHLESVVAELRQQDQ